MQRIDPRQHPDIRGVIEADEVYAGRGVVVEPGVVIRAKRVVLGDYCYVGAGVKVFAEEFRIGDYSKWHEHGLGSGDGDLQISRNCWIGRDVVLDAKGGLTLEDGVGIGHGSQLYTHVQFGDVLWVRDGLYQRKGMRVGHDAWFVGHCLVSPVEVEPWSMALLGSVITRPMRENRVYGGNPAFDITDKFAPQLPDSRRDLEREQRLQTLINCFAFEHEQWASWLQVTREADLQTLAAFAPDTTIFDVTTRTYTQTHSPAEVAFLKAHVPLVKFVPYGKPPFVDTPIEELVTDE